ncbi:MAG: DUF6693 family protein [Bacteroidota bacterium]
MKKYLSFHLKGEEIFKYFIFLLLIILIPTLIFLNARGWDNSQDLTTSEWILVFVLFLFAFFGSLALMFFIYKLSIENVEYDNERLGFSGDMGKFFRIIVKGILLTVITIGIYLPWFVKEVYGFFIEESSYRQKHFKFLAKASDLFVVFLLAFLIPMIILAIFFHDNNYRDYSMKGYLYNNIQTVILAPFIFFYYRWFINIKFSDFHIKFDADIMEGIGVVLLQTLLITLTFGIYFPVGYLKIYRYYLNKTKVEDEAGKKIHLDYEMDSTNDFLFIWGQTLLSIITIGIYSPWAYCKVMGRVLGKTSLEELG